MGDNKRICDGCNVREPHEHRCHVKNIVIKGEHTSFDCECSFCAESRAYAEKIKTMTADELKYGNRMWE